jgi:hypothetical protein
VEIAGLVPVWALALIAFGVQFWLFCLLPCWVNKDADVIDPGNGGFDGAVPVAEPVNRRHYSP